MIMVDQLWLWVIAPDTNDSGNKHGCNSPTLNGYPETMAAEGNLTSLITFFPRKECESDKDTQCQTADLK
jgi:hypothetical protein